MKTHSEELAVFVQVVENGSFSRAANQLNLDNSVVSRMIKRLESKLGVNLLNRTTRQLSLTQEGQRYFERVQKALQEMAAAEADILALHQVPQGLLRIDAATPVLLNVLAPYLPEFQQRYPHIELSLLSSENFINLIERKVDVAIRAGQLDNSGLRARHLFNSYRKVIASPDYLARFGTPTMPSELRQHRYLGFIEPLSLNTLPLQDENGKPLVITPTLTANNGETLRSLCLQGLGITCLSDFMVDQDLNAGKLIELFPNQRLAQPFPFHAVYYSDHAVSIRIRVFIDFLLEKIRS